MGENGLTMTICDNHMYIYIYVISVCLLCQF